MSAVTVSKPLYCCRCDSALTIAELMTPALFLDLCDACSVFELAEIAKHNSDPRESMPDGPLAPNDGFHYEQ